jgi:hypothetical protein
VQEKILKRYYLNMKEAKCNHSIIAFFKKKKFPSQVPMAHTCNSSYLGGRDEEDSSSKPAQANSS